ncbi:MAG: hypothetical protein AB7S38_18745 [Vulcanimicrobiota bacterium]
MTRKGIALVYVLMICAVLTAFLGALFVRVSQSLQMATFNQDHVRASHVSQLGLDLAFVLMRDVNAEWFKSLPSSVENTDPYFNDEFTDETIGGHFTLQFKDPDEVPGANLALPNEGTYKILVSTGRAGRSTVRSFAYVKVTNPIVNFLMVSQNVKIGPEVDVDGPMFINGDARVMHAGRNPGTPVGISGYWGGDLSLAGEIHATGDIYIRNFDSAVTPLIAPVTLEGEYPAKTFQHLDMDPPVGIPGQIHIQAGFCADPQADFAVHSPTMRELLTNYQLEATHMTHSDTVEVPAEGLLLEFDGGKAVCTPVKTREVGKLFDRGAVLDAYGVGHTGPYPYDGNLMTYMAEDEYPGNGLNHLLDEVAWDDPQFANETYPVALQSGTFSGPSGSITFPTATEGDAFPVYRIVRDNDPLASQTVTINTSGDGDDWHFIILHPKTGYQHDMLNYDPDDPGLPSPMKAFPPVYVRGILDGRVVLIYDVPNSLWDPLTDELPAAEAAWNGYPGLHLYVLAQHEMSDDSPSNHLSRPIPGGIHYANKQIKSSPGPDPATFTNDGLIMVSRGTLGAFGTHGHFFSHLYRGETLYNYRKALWEADADMVTRYGGGTWDQDFRIVGSTNTWFNQQAVATIYGVGVSNWTLNNFFRPHYADPSATQLVAKTHPQFAHTWDDVWRWNALNLSSTPPGVNTTKCPLVASIMRRARIDEAWKWRVRGSLHSLNTEVGLAGELDFDYSFQELTDDQIKEQLHLPLGPILLRKMGTP